MLRFIHFFLDQAKKGREIHRHFLIQDLYRIEGFYNGNSFSSLYYVSKKFNIPPLLVKYAIDYSIKIF